MGVGNFLCFYKIKSYSILMKYLEMKFIGIGEIEK